jgi:hypothetical protein
MSQEPLLLLGGLFIGRPLFALEAGGSKGFDGGLRYRVNSPFGRAASSVGERYIDTVEVRSSILLPPTTSGRTALGAVFLLLPEDTRLAPLSDHPPPEKKWKGAGCIVAVLVVIALAITVAMIAIVGSVGSHR